MNDKVNCWDIISKLRYDKSYWHHLEPAEIMEIVQRIKEGKKKIYGLDKWFKIDLRPAKQKLNRMRSHVQVFHVHNFNLQKISS